MKKLVIILAIKLASLFVAPHESVYAQNIVQFIPAGVADWNEPTSWQDIGAGQNIPSFEFDEIGLIATGGTAQVSTVSSTNPGGVQINNGTLQVLDGGSLSAFVGFGSLAQGVIDIGGDGTLSVASGGTLSGQSFISNGNLRTIGTTASMSVANQFTFGSSSTFTAEIKAATHSTISAGGIAALGGNLVADFAGYSPSATDSWDLLTAPTITGGFNAVTAVGLGVLPLGQALVVKNVAGGAQGKVVRLSLDRQLVLSVNRTTKVMSITNPHNVPVAMDSYAIRSSVGSLDGSAWNSLQDQGVGGGSWFETGTGGTTNRLAELNQGSQTSFLASSSTALGPVYSPHFTSFGVETEDYTFTYATPSGEIVSGQIDFTGDKQFNNLVLTVDPTTGQGQIRNDSTISVGIEGYVIGSVAGGLLSGSSNWSSLQDQAVEGGAWFEANSDANQLAELRDDGTTLLAANQGYNIGGLFATSSAHDLTFRFLIDGESIPRTGVVVYGALPPVTPPGQILPGDYNDNRTVDAADFVLWRKNLGSSTILPNDSTSGTVTAEDYQVWRDNFGNAGGNGAGITMGTSVPEPSILGLLVGVAICCAPRRLRLGVLDYRKACCDRRIVFLELHGQK